MEVAIKGREDELSMILSQFFKILYVDFGVNKFSDKIKNWYDLSWDDFKKEMVENHSVHWNECLINDWKDFFSKHKQKVQKLLM